MITQTTPPQRLVVFLVDVSDSSPFFQRKLFCAMNRLLATHSRVPHCKTRWTYQLFHSSYPGATFKSPHLEPLIIPSESLQTFKHQFYQLVRNLKSRTTTCVSSCTAVVRAMEDLVASIDGYNMTHSPSHASSETKRTGSVTSPHPRQAGHSLPTVVYLLSNAPKVARDVVTSGPHISDHLVTGHVSSGSKPVSCDPHIHLSCSETSHDPPKDVKCTVKLTNILRALAHRNIQLNWIDTDMTRFADFHICNLLTDFSQVISSVSPSCAIVHINSLFLDERIIPIESLFRHFGQDPACGGDFLSPAGRGVASSTAKWVDIDMGVERATVLEHRATGKHLFRNKISAQFTSEDMTVLDPLLKVGQSAQLKVVSPRLRMVLRGYVPELNDEELDKLHGFDHGAGLLRPASRGKGNDIAELSWGESLFAGLMAHLAFTHAHVVADIVAIEKDKKTKLRSVLITPLSASIANVRIVKTSSKLGAVSVEDGLNMVPEAFDANCAHPNPRSLLISNDSSRGIFSRFLPSLWNGDTERTNTGSDQAANSLMTEMKKQSLSNSPRDLLHVGSCLDNAENADGNPRFDAICDILSKNRACISNQSKSSSKSLTGTAEQRQNLWLKLRLREFPSTCTGKSSKEKHSAPSQRKDSVDTREVGTQSSISVGNTTHEQQNSEENYSISETLDASQDSGPSGSIRQMIIKRNSPSALARKEPRHDPKLEPAAVPRKGAPFESLNGRPLDTSPGDSEIVTTNYSEEMPKSPSNYVVSKPGNTGQLTGAKDSEGVPARSESRRTDLHHGIKRSGAELLREASVHSNHCRSRLMNAQVHNIREEVRACLDCISSIVQLIANADHWESIRGCVASYMQRKSQILSSLRGATKELEHSLHEVLDLPPPSFWNTILDALEQVVWQVAEGANCGERRVSGSGRKRVQRHTKRAISVLNSIQLIAPSIPTLVGQSFFGEVLAEFLQVVLMKFLHGTHQYSFVNALSIIFVDYDIDYSSACFAIEREDNAAGDCPRQDQRKFSSETIRNNQARSEANSDNVSLHSQRKRVFSESNDPGRHPSKKPRKSSHRELSEIIADSRNKSAAKDRSGSRRSRRALDLGRARSLQKPLSVAREKHRKAHQQ